MDRLSKTTLGLTLLLVVIPVALVGTAVAQGLAANLLQLGAAALAAIMCLTAARRVDRSARLAWVLLGLGAASWAIGQAIWTFQEEMMGDAVPFPGPADIGFLAASVLAVPAVLLFMRAPNSRSEPWLLFLDGLGTALLMMMAAWILMLRAPTLAEPDHLAATIGALYPFLDLVVIGALLSAFPRLGGPEKVRLWPLVCGLVAIAVADFTFNYDALIGAYHTGSWPDFGWVAGFGLIAFFASDPGAARNELRTGPPSRLEMALPFLPVPVAAAAVVFDQVRGVAPDPTLVGGAVAWLLVTSARMFFLVRRQHHLMGQLQRKFDLELEAAQMRERVIDLERGQAQESFRREFINKTAHEFATPLTPIRMQLHILLNHPDATPAMARSLTLLDRNIARLYALADDLVDAARVDSSKLVLERRVVDLEDLVRMSVLEVRDDLEARGLRLDVEVDGPHWVLADRVRMERAIASLVLRAAQATPPGGVVGVKATAEQGQAHVAITHEGPMASSPFDAFGTPGVPGSNGSAVALHLARGLLGLHGADLKHDAAERGGSFRFRMPLHTTSPPSA